MGARRGIDAGEQERRGLNVIERFLHPMADLVVFLTSRLPLTVDMMPSALDECASDRQQSEMGDGEARRRRIQAR